MRNSIVPARLFGRVSRQIAKNQSVAVIEHVEIKRPEPRELSAYCSGREYSIWHEFQQFVPQLDVLGIVIPGVFFKAEERDGEYLAYYDHIVINRSTKHREVTTFLYGYDRGIKFCIKFFPTRHYPL